VQEGRQSGRSCRARQGRRSEYGRVREAAEAA
jgi:hypothetical protein